jgi:hypothetical protein
MRLTAKYLTTNFAEFFNKTVISKEVLIKKVAIHLLCKKGQAKLIIGPQYHLTMNAQC